MGGPESVTCGADVLLPSHCGDSVRDRGTPQMTGSSLGTLGIWGELVGVAQAVIWLRVGTIVFSKSKSWFYRQGVPVGIECHLHGAFPWTMVI